MNGAVGSKVSIQPLLDATSDAVQNLSR